MLGTPHAYNSWAQGPWAPGTLSRDTVSSHRQDDVGIVVIRQLSEAADKRLRTEIAFGISKRA